jgi:hypothetical protein
MLSVGHWPELEEFHTRKIELERRPGGAKLIRDVALMEPIPPRRLATHPPARKMPLSASRAFAEAALKAKGNRADNPARLNRA